MKYYFLFAFPLLLSGCSQLPNTDSEQYANETFDWTAAQPHAKAAETLAKAQNGFGGRLLSQLANKQISFDDNLLISPISIWQALALTASGSRGETATQSKALLGLQGMSDEKIGASNRAFTALLGQQKGASLLVANSVWFADSFKPNPTFTERAKTDFAATINQFSPANSEEASQRINQWVSDKTKGEIPQIVGAEDIQGQSALLVNAVYFKGTWSKPFEKDQTQPETFYLKSGGTVDVPMMNGERESAYLDGKNFEGVRLPYKNTSCALWAMLPRKGKTTTAIVRELSTAQMHQLQSSKSVTISLPLFDIEWRKELKQDLAAKAPLLFSPQADLSGIGAPTAGISAVLHICKMRIDEEGTVAVAATDMNAAAGEPMQEDKPKVIKFDHPFVVAVVEEMSGARLFEAVVNNPAN